ncbi:MAG TPA: DUF6235 family protein [Pseudonocardiaceae bacterium]|jgi:hypothetical protein
MADERRCLRLTSGLRRLEQWATAASQTEKNAVYKALFAIADGSAFSSYKITHEVHRMGELSVQVRDDLVIRICFRHFDAFGIVYIGSLDSRELGVSQGA